MTAGAVYRVRIGGTDGATGTGDIEVTCTPAAECEGDTNGDGDVNVDDLNNIILDWGTDGSANGGDVSDNTGAGDPDGIVDVGDLVAVITAWGDCP